MPSSRKSGQRASASWTERKSVPSDTDGASLLPANPAPKCPMNTRRRFYGPPARLQVGSEADVECGDGVPADGPRTAIGVRWWVLGLPPGASTGLAGALRRPAFRVSILVHHE